jgi:diacylglycerol kinase (ATP)
MVDGGGLLSSCLGMVGKPRRGFLPGLGIVDMNLPCFKHATLIYNPVARKLQKDCRGKIQAIREAVTSRGINLEEVPTEQSLHAIELAHQAVAAKTDLIIGCGGDGTINEIVGGMAGSQVPLLVLPAGTANVLAKDIRLPRELLSSLKLLETGQIRLISLGKANGRYFTLMAGIGVDAGIAAAVNPRWKKKIGEGAFWLAGLQQLFRYSFPSFKISTGGQVYQGTFAVIARARSYGGPLEIVPQADLFSKRFNVCLFEKGGRLAYLRYFCFVFLRRHISLRDVKCFSGESFEITGPSETWAQVDGELLGNLPLKISLVPDALALMVPSTEI